MKAQRKHFCTYKAALLEWEERPVIVKRVHLALQSFLESSFPSLNFFHHGAVFEGRRKLFCVHSSCRLKHFSFVITYIQGNVDWRVSGCESPRFVVESMKQKRMFLFAKFKTWQKHNFVVICSYKQNENCDKVEKALWKKWRHFFWCLCLRKIKTKLNGKKWLLRKVVSYSFLF